MRYQQLSIKQTTCYLLPLVVFILPLSQSLKSILFPLTIIALLLQPTTRSALQALLREAWVIALLLLFAVIVLGSFYSEAPWNEKTSFIVKYSKLLYLPVFAIGFQDKDCRERAVGVYLFAMLITVIVSFMKILGWVKIVPTYDPGAVFYNHIITGYYMAFAAFIAAIYSLRKTGKSRYIYAGLALLFSYHALFINTGRTGYVIYAILLALFLVYTLPLRKIPFYFLLLLPLLALTAYQSSTLTNGLKNAIYDVKYFNSGNKNTSIGFRLQFHEYAKKLFLSSPVLGQGTASFSHHFNQDQPIPAWGPKLLDPHNQYWLMAAEHGVLGLLALLYFFLTLFYACRQLQDMRIIMIGVISSFVAANLFDSFLLFSATGYFLIIFAAICLGESITMPLPATRKEALQEDPTPC